jgi:Protein kinase domain
VARTVDRYEIRGEIGRGGTATVHLACQTDLRRLVALKELSAFGAVDPGAARRFVRESQLSASLSHPSIVTVHDYFEADGIPFIAMEYLPNGSLRSRVGALPLERFAGTLEAMLGGLAHAHAHGIVHRDLKPENVLVTADGGVKIADFGIAKAIDSVETRLTVTGTTIGTPSYMAPEQALARELGPWTDLYSLGIVAFELIAGRPPFGDAEPVAILMRHVKDVPPPLARVAPSTPPAVSDWVARLLEKEPDDRPASANEAWESLEEIVLAELGPRWRRKAALPAVAAGAPTPATRPMITADGAVVDPGDEDPRLAPTVTPRIPLEPPVVAGVVAPARARKRPFWRIALGLVVLGWAVAALAIGALSGGGGGPSPAGTADPAGTPPVVPEAVATEDPPANRSATPTASPTATPTATATATPTPRPTPQGSSGAGDSVSDDPSDDEPDGGEP